MIETETRPLTPDERAVLSKGPGLPVRWTAGVGAALAATVIVWLLALLFADASPGIELRLALVALAAGLAVYVYVQRRERHLLSGLSLRDDAQAGTARVTRYDVRDALAVDEFEDEGLSYYLELADGRVVFLMGQYLYEPVEHREFPARRVEIVRTMVTDTVLKVTALGPHLPPSATRGPFRTDEFDGDRVPADGTVLPGPLAQYRGDAT